MAQTVMYETTSDYTRNMSTFAFKHLPMFPRKTQTFEAELCTRDFFASCSVQGRKFRGGGGAHDNPLAFENFVFFAQKNEKNRAFESILVTNPYERTCYAPPAASRS